MPGVETGGNPRRGSRLVFRANGPVLAWAASYETSGPASCGSGNSGGIGNEARYVRVVPFATVRPTLVSRSIRRLEGDGASR